MIIFSILFNGLQKNHKTFIKFCLYCGEKDFVPEGEIAKCILLEKYKLFTAFIEDFVEN